MLKEKIPISVFIITKNEADRLPRAINSVKEWVEEVIVVDSGSTDNTVVVARELGARVMHQDWKGYGEQKSFGEAQCSQKWILNIDADEEVTYSLKNEIIKIFLERKNDQVSAYKLQVKATRIFTHSVPVCGPRTICVRLYDRTKAGFSCNAVHDSVLVREGVIGALKGILKHYSFRSYTHALQKIESYSTAQALDMYDKGRKPSDIRIVFEPVLAFFKAYILKRSFALGFEGVVLSYIYVIGRLSRLIKARDLFVINSKRNNKDKLKPE